jgi:hypothetical protein
VLEVRRSRALLDGRHIRQPKLLRCKRRSLVHCA